MAPGCCDLSATATKRESMFLFQSVADVVVWLPGNKESYYNICKVFIAESRSDVITVRTRIRILIATPVGGSSDIAIIICL